MPTVAITDYTFPDLTIEEAILRPLGAELLSGQCKTAESLIPLVSQADAVITQFAPIRADVIAASHIASASPKAVSALRGTAARIAAAALRGEPLPNVVNGLN